MRIKIILLLMLFALSFAHGQTSVTYVNLYVDASRQLNGDGSSWGTAYNDLNDAITYAMGHNSGFNIYIAEGTYKPNYSTLNGTPLSSQNVTTEDAEIPEDELGIALHLIDVAANGAPIIPTTTTNYTNILTTKEAAFAIKSGAIKLYGGYPSGGGLRNISAHPTILSGDLGSGNKAYHVLLIGGIHDQDGVFQDNVQNDSIVVDGVTIRDGNAIGIQTTNALGFALPQSNGGGIYFAFESTETHTDRIVIRNCTFTNNNAVYGGAIFSSQASPLITNCVFQNNTCSAMGASLFCMRSGPTISYCNFNNEHATMAGGAIFAQSSNLVLAYSNFNNNVSDVFGCISNFNSTLKMKSCNLTGNHSGEQAGAILNYNGDMIITECSFTSNYSKNGGAILNYNANMILENSTFTNNYAQVDAGAIWIRGLLPNTNLSLKSNGCVFDGNYTINSSDPLKGSGGALMIDSMATPEFRDCKFLNNHSKQQGVFILLANAAPSFISCLFKNNTSTYTDAIGKNQSNASCNFNNCNFIENTCSYSGTPEAGYGSGGILITNNPGSTTNFESSLFYNNSSLNSSFGIFSNQGTSTLRNCVFNSNKTKEQSSTIFNQSGTESLNIYSTTFSDNTTVIPPNMGVTAMAGTVNAFNSIFFNSTNYGLWAPSNSSATMNIHNCDVNPPYNTNNNNMYAAPQFVNQNDPDGLDNTWGTVDDGLHLSANSTLVNAGDNAQVPFSFLSPKDFKGAPRIDGANVDIGAYENAVNIPATALTFDGINNFIDVDGINVSGDYTAEIRIKPKQKKNYLFGIPTTDKTDPSYLLSFTSSTGLMLDQLILPYNSPSYGGITVSTPQNAPIISPYFSGFYDGNWHHVAYVKKGNEFSIYIDGYLINRSNIISQNSMVAKWLTIGNKYKGDIEEVRIWNRALCGDEINQHTFCELPSGQTSLRAYYKFNQGNSAKPNPTQTALIDASGNGLNGVLGNFDLNGTNNWMASPNSVSTVCSAYSSLAINATSNSPVTTGASLLLNSTVGFNSYAWTGPNSYSSNAQSVNISGCTSLAAGTYTVVGTKNGCTSTATANVVVNPQAASALAFDGTNKVTVPHLQLGNEYTIQANFKTSASAQTPIISWIGTNGDQTSLYIKDNGSSIRLYQQSNGLVGYYLGTESGLLNDNVWHNVTITQQANRKVEMYIDGALRYSYLSPLLSMPVTSSCYIGDRPGYSSFNGQIDEVRIWNRALCQNEISNNINCEISGSSTGLQIYYKFNQGFDNDINTTTTSVTDIAGGDQNGALVGFALNGTLSNWVKGTGAGSITSGNSCSPFNSPNLNSITGNSIVIANGDVTPSTNDYTDFGLVDNSTTTSNNFTITNSGTGVLNVASIVVSGADASFFTVSGSPTTIAAASTGSFAINFIPAGSTNTKTATITINSDDCRNTPYSFNVSAKGIALVAGASLNFDGINDYTANNSISIGNVFTIEAKVKTSVGGNLTIANLSQSGTINRCFQLFNGYLKYSEQDGSGTQSFVFGTTINDNQWHHVAITRNINASNNVSMYVDGLFIGTGTANKLISPNTLQVGTNNNSNFFKGNIDELRIWTRELCAPEIDNAKNCEVSAGAIGLYVYYKFNQGFDAFINTNITTISDATSNAKNGTLNGFALGGTTSNFSGSGGVTTGISCGTANMPTIEIKDINSINISNNDLTPSISDHTDFGSIDVNNGMVQNTFTIKNTGTNILNINGTIKVTITGTGFSLVQDAASSVNTSSQTTFIVGYDPAVAGTNTGTITISSNDCNNPIYSFSILGTGTGTLAVSATNLKFAQGNYVSLGNISPTSYTKECWFKFTNNTYANYIFCGSTSNDHRLWAPGAYGWDYKLSAGGPGAWKSVQDQTPLVINTWYHVALTYDAVTTTMKLYKNGTLVSVNYNVPPSTSNMMYLGSEGASGQFAGDMDEVRVWNRVLCQSEIQNNMNTELTGTQAGLIAYYKCNQGLGGANNVGVTTLTDATGLNNNGTLTNFTLTGSTSNWVNTSSITTGSSAPTLNLPEISLNAQGLEIVNNDNTPSTTNGTNFGSVQATGGNFKSQVFTINNLSNNPLIISGAPLIKITGTVFSLASTLSNGTIASNSSDNFSINFTPTIAGVFTDTVKIYNNDCDEQVYMFLIRGTGIAPVTSSAISFDGSNDRVDVPVALQNVFDPINKMSVEAWVYPTINSGNGIIIGNYATPLPQEQFLLRRENNHYLFSIDDGTGFKYLNSANNTVVLNTWQHLAGVWDGSKMSFYINGVLSGTLSGINGPSFPTVTNKVVIGGNGGEYFNGKIDEVRLWSRALCVEEINNNLNNCEVSNTANGLVAYYKFNDGYADAINTGNTTLVDATSNFNGTLVNFNLNGTSSNWIGNSPVVNGANCAAYNKPIISVSGNSVVIANNDNTPSYSDFTDFGFSSNGSQMSRVFFVNNIGTGSPLLLTNVSKVVITGSSAFGLLSDANYSVNAGANSSFGIFYTPTDESVSTATVIIYSNDCANPIYTFTIKASSVPAVALDFDGLDDKVTISASNINNQFTNNAITLEGWFYPKGNPIGNAAMITEAYLADNNVKFSLYQSGLSVYGGFYDGSWHLVNTPITLNTWQHIVCTYDQQNLKLYINGVLISSTPQTNPLPAGTEEWYLGKRWDSPEFFQGKMDEVRIWNRALCVSEINNNMSGELNPSQNGLIAYYKFNEGGDNVFNPSYNNLPDLSGNHNNGILTNFNLNGLTSNWVSPGPFTADTIASIYYPNEMDVISNNTSIANGDITPSVSDNTEFGSVAYINNGTITKTFSVTNFGGATLNLSTFPRVNLIGTGYTLVSDLPATIAAGASANFVIAFDPLSAGSFSGTVTIANDDCDEFNYTFSIHATGTNPGPASALNFDGINDYIDVPSIPSLPQGNSSRTIEAWFKTNASGSFQSIVNYGTTNSDERFGMLLDPNGRLYFSGGNNDLVANTILNDNIWHHAAVTFDSVTVRIYIDGALQTSSIINLNTFGMTLNIGNSVGPIGGQFFNGLIDEVRVYNRALRAQEIGYFSHCELLGTENELVAYYKFNQGLDQGNNSTVNSLTDNSIGAHNGTLNNFTLNNSTSNWVNPGAIISNVSCNACVINNSTVLNVSSCTAYQSPSGLIWNTGGVYHDTLRTILGCDSIITINLSLTILDANKTISTSSNILCGSGGSSISINNSQVGITYSLVNAITMQTLGTSASGNGNAIVLNTGLLTQSTILKIKAEIASCYIYLNASDTIYVVGSPDVTIYIDSVNSALVSGEFGGSYQWLDCSNNYAVIPSAISQTFIPASIGNYAVQVKNSYGCVDTSMCTLFGGTVGINQLHNSSEFIVNIYPNPNSGEFIVDLPEDAKVIVLNSLGQIVFKDEFKKGKQKVILNEFESGVYFVQINSSKKIVTKRIIVTK